jgi:hypothetical protein
MAFILHSEGAQYILQTAFSEEVAGPPANFYLGLCNDDLVATDALADILGEPATGGYGRQEVPSSAVGFVVTADGDGFKITLSEESFTPVGATWADVSTVFLATTSDNSGKLICSWTRAVDDDIQDGWTYKPTGVMTIT